VRAKKTFAEKTAAASNMKYVIIPASHAQRGLYRKSFMPDSREQYLEEVIQQSLILNEQEK